jgi:hypothetical protein
MWRGCPRPRLTKIKATPGQFTLTNKNAARKGGVKVFLKSEV